MEQGTPISLPIFGLEQRVMEADTFMGMILEHGGEELLRTVELLIYYREAQFHDYPGEASKAIMERVYFALNAPRCPPFWAADKDGHLSVKQLREMAEWTAWSGVRNIGEMLGPVYVYGTTIS